MTAYPFPHFTPNECQSVILVHPCSGLGTIFLQHNLTETLHKVSCAVLGATWWAPGHSLLVLCGFY